MQRNEAWTLLQTHISNKNSLKHMLSTEAIMKSLAKRLNQDEELWSLVGLIHDIDMEKADYKTNPEEHGRIGEKILQEAGFSREVTDAVLAHNEMTGKTRGTLLEKAIYCADPLTGLIVAATLVLPEKKLSSLTEESLLKRFKEKSFAAGARREVINSCVELGLDLEEFISIGLEAMKGISEELGL